MTGNAGYTVDELIQILTTAFSRRLDDPSALLIEAEPGDELLAGLTTDETQEYTALVQAIAETIEKSNQKLREDLLQEVYGLLLGR